MMYKCKYKNKNKLCKNNPFIILCSFTTGSVIYMTKKLAKTSAAMHGFVFRAFVLLREDCGPRLKQYVRGRMASSMDSSAVLFIQRDLQLIQIHVLQEEIWVRGYLALGSLQVDCRHWGLIATLFGCESKSLLFVGKCCGCEP